MGYSCYAGKYSCPMVVMRFNRSDFIVAVDGESVNKSIADDKELIEVSLDSPIEIGTASKTELVSKLGIAIDTAESYAQLMPKIIKRSIPYFDMKLIEKHLAEKKIVWIDLINAEMG